MSEWQPIETAPDGQDWILLLYDRHGEPEVRCGFRGQGQHGEPLDTWFESEASSGSLTDFRQPTHWMPFTPPKR